VVCGPRIGQANSLLAHHSLSRKDHSNPFHRLSVLPTPLCKGWLSTLRQFLRSQHLTVHLEGVEDSVEVKELFPVLGAKLN
jgi:hypothetical protein